MSNIKSPTILDDRGLAIIQNENKMQGQKYVPRGQFTVSVYIGDRHVSSKWISLISMAPIYTCTVRDAKHQM